MKRLLIIFLILSSSLVFAQNKVYSVKVALLKYSGGGDWYANPTSLPNLAIFCNQTINTNIDPNIPEVEPGSQDIFNYPFIHMTGHGNVIFSDQEAANLRKYLESGGFLHIDDNYGMDPFIRLQIKKIFPDIELIELPPSHPIFSQYFNFPNGLPKIHEHDGKAPQAFGIILNGRLVLLYTYECDLGDGWESEEVHNDPPEVRLKALQMGANIIHYAFNL
ncbi:MAG TPA: DUF4159 domain-containing protein [Bacteroidales bacterium]|jgi:hypothetical protein|nr:DUF4159 domain-containing protein [Bacteroidales bacterium]HOL74624.1 DUF4159 domain-containing protein [Bacteroidales bacterium]